MPKDHTSTSAAGTAFENQVASVFAAAGYIVERNQNIFGQQVDLIASSFESLGFERKALVECKFKSRGSVSNSEVQDFIRFVEPLLKKGFSSGILVTNRQFSLQAQAFSRWHSVP